MGGGGIIKENLPPPHVLNIETPKCFSQLI
jgi:hypothetical protein